MSEFEKFITQLSDQELLSVLRYRKSELSSDQIEKLNQLIKIREIDPTQYDKMTIESKNTIKDITCPRCASGKLLSNANEKYPNFQSLLLVWRYLPFGLKVDYQCQICLLKFRRRIPIEFVLSLLKKY